MSNVSFSLSKALLNSKRLNWLYKDNIHYSCIPIPHNLIIWKKLNYCTLCEVRIRLFFLPSGILFDTVVGTLCGLFWACSCPPTLVELIVLHFFWVWQKPDMISYYIAQTWMIKITYNNNNNCKTAQYRCLQPSI